MRLRQQQQLLTSIHRVVKVTAHVSPLILHDRERNNMLCKFFLLKITMFFFSQAFTLLNLFKIRASCWLTCRPISLEEPLDCICTKISAKVNVFI